MIIYNFCLPLVPFLFGSSFVDWFNIYKYLSRFIFLIRPLFSPNFTMKVVLYSVTFTRFFWVDQRELIFQLSWLETKTLYEFYVFTVLCRTKDDLISLSRFKRYFRPQVSCPPRLTRPSTRYPDFSQFSIVTKPQDKDWTIKVYPY